MCAHFLSILFDLFQGRVNKLVDGCYSFWQGAALVIVAEELVKNVSPYTFFIIYD